MLFGSACGPSELTQMTNPLDFIEGGLVAAPVIEAGRARALVIGHLLRDFEPATILEVGRDAGGAEGVAGDLGLDPGCKRPHSSRTLNRSRREKSFFEQKGAAPPAL
jgi:hypothetical protein